MTKRFLGSFCLAAAVLAGGGSASAHFQMLYVEDSALDRGGATDMALVFTHPFAGGPNMDMGPPRAFYVVHQRGDEGELERTDLMEHLTDATWTGAVNSAVAYRAHLPREIVRSLGDYVFALEPEPFYEEGEDKYIQQFTKLVMNVGGVPGNWSEPLGLPAEIRLLNKPYANWTGGVFRGVVLSGGEPVPYAEIEIEYVNFAPDLEANAFSPEPAAEAPHPSFGTMSILADADGEFSIGLPKAGWWGVCALDVGPVKEHEGKPLSQDAVLWIQATDMPQGAAQ